jgi:hypothetical protein
MGTANQGHERKTFTTYKKKCRLKKQWNTHTQLCKLVLINGQNISGLIVFTNPMHKSLGKIKIEI